MPARKNRPGKFGTVNVVTVTQVLLKDLSEHATAIKYFQRCEQLDPGVHHYASWDVIPCANHLIELGLLIKSAHLPSSYRVTDKFRQLPRLP
jgi:hypothetical protein